LNSQHSPFGETGSSSPKVLVVSGSAYALGGMERVMQRLGRGLAAYGYEAEVIIPAGEMAPKLQRWFEDHGTSAVASEELADLSRRGFRAIQPFIEFLRQRNADLINLHSPGHHIPLAEVLAARLAGAQTVTSIHGFDPGETGRFEKLRNRIVGSALNRRVIAPSELVRKQQLEKRISPRKLDMIHYGVEVPRASLDRAEARRRLGIGEDTFLIVTFGRLVPDKGIDTLIEAVKRLSVDLRSRLQVLIGGIGDQPLYESQLRDSDQQIVKFLGHVNDTGSYYAAADLFVLSSRHEPFGLVFVEAAQRGVPSIGTRVGGIPEAIEDHETGLLVAREDPAALRDAIELLSRDKEYRQRLGVAAEKRARQMFGEDTMISSYAALYDSVLHRDIEPAPATV
jgi:L-malate glycosyltransferase